MSNIPEISCIKSTEYSIHTRRCFITGEYCSQQTNIQKERQKLHDKGDINAFVIMNFSSVSDVVYEARIKPFIEGLSKYLYLDNTNKKIRCASSDESKKCSEDSPWKKVNHIHVHRADSNPASNYIICSRICQQMQMADLIIVDVSAESANVFYEFGLATAFHKLILPICFSDNFFARKLPEKLEKVILAQQEQFAKNTEGHSLKDIARTENTDSPLKALERHIDCYPWRRKLFEHFGLRFQESPAKDKPAQAFGEKDIHYVDASIAMSEKFGFSDFKYACFPYDRTIGDVDQNSNKIGLQIYNWLKNSYNRPQNAVDSEDQNHQPYDEKMFDNRGKHPSCNNTLVVYTMDRFLNEDEAGLCIINFYNNITKPMLDNYCFCGDRVAILGQPNRMWDDPKDGKINKPLRYSVSDLIRIGMDQATYSAERRRIKTGDYLEPSSVQVWDKERKKAINKHIKTHVRNRCIPLSPENPIYITQLKEGIQQRIPKEVVEGIAEKAKKDDRNEYYFFCLYHVMLDTLRYVNEVVVDLSSNSVQSMFWLGAAHGSDVYAVTVRQEMTEKEKAWSGVDAIQTDRPIFDIGGLWTAMLHYDEIDSFYKQLELIQQGIDQHARLKLPETELEAHEYKVFRQLYHASPFRLGDNNGDKRIKKIQEELTEKSRAESRALESYYRDRFWRQLLRDNQLHLFLDLFEKPLDGPKLLVSKWDMDTVAELSHYLSKRKVIGKYQFDTLEKNKPYEEDARRENFISIGSAPKPLKVGNEARSLAAYINREGQEKPKIRVNEKVCTMHAWPPKKESSGDQKKDECRYEYRYFRRNADEWYGTQYMNHICIGCSKTPNTYCKKVAQWIEEKSDKHAFGGGKKISSVRDGYILPAQLILWREAQEAQKTDNESSSRIEYKYHVSLVGVSGPATKALTALLVDDEQKGNIWGKKGKKLGEDITRNLKRYLPLNILQTHIRKEFYQKFTEDVKDLKAAYYAAGFLSTILPQYFLPFLSQADEKRIYNAMEAFLQTTEVKKETVDSMLAKLKNLLSEFHGVEALYKVQVATPSSGDKDERKIINIELLCNENDKNRDNKPIITCLYAKTRERSLYGK